MKVMIYNHKLIVIIIIRNYKKNKIKHNQYIMNKIILMNNSNNKIKMKMRL